MCRRGHRHGDYFGAADAHLRSDHHRGCGPANAARRGGTGGRAQRPERRGSVFVDANETGAVRRRPAPGGRALQAAAERRTIGLGIRARGSRADCAEAPEGHPPAQHLSDADQLPLRRSATGGGRRQRDCPVLSGVQLRWPILRSGGGSPASIRAYLRSLAAAMSSRCAAVSRSTAACRLFPCASMVTIAAKSCTCRCHMASGIPKSSRCTPSTLSIERA